jgi:Xaa-Pro aminopeptidase
VPSIAEQPFPRFSSRELARRHRATRAAMASQQLDALLVVGLPGRHGSAVHYLTDYPVSNRAHLIFPAEGESSLFVQLWNHLPLARRLSTVVDTRWGGPSSIQSVVDELRARGLAAARIGVAGELPFNESDALRSQLPELELVDFNPAYRRLRMIKSDEELDWLRRGAILSDLAAAALEHHLRPGLSEIELGAIMEGGYVGAGGWHGIHYLLSTPMTDPSICVPAQQHSTRRVEAGDVVVVEITAEFWGYGGQVLRTYTVETEPTPLYQELHDVALACFDRITALLRPGATAQQVVGAAEAIHQAGFSIYDDLLHGYGGGYLPPVLRTSQTTHGPVPDFQFEENMTVVVQPNVITPDERAGVQVGELVRITAAGCESLHTYPRRRAVVG